MKDRPSQSKSHHSINTLKILVQIHSHEIPIETVVEVIVTLVIITLTQILLILVLVQPLTIEMVKTLITTITYPTDTTTTLLIITLIVVTGMTNIIKIHTLILNPTTLLLALLLDITPTLVLVPIVAIQEITPTRSDPIKLPIAPLLNHAVRRSRSHSNSKPQFQPALNHIEPNPSDDNPFEINMKYPTITNAIIPSTWYFILYVSKPKTDTSTSSKLEILSLSWIVVLPFLFLIYPHTLSWLKNFYIVPLISTLHLQKLSLLLIKPKFLSSLLLTSLAELLLTMTLIHLLSLLLWPISNIIPLALHFLNNMLNPSILKS